mmetsp:Transcript_16396/g.42579  ORF Transcript_16396/g.42579 Transcript_16396/m.42579 type:complete len:203 (-) Transcript_16396:1117-1725(-)
MVRRQAQHLPNGPRRLAHLGKRRRATRVHRHGGHSHIGRLPPRLCTVPYQPVAQCLRGPGGHRLCRRQPKRRRLGAVRVGGLWGRRLHVVSADQSHVAVRVDRRCSVAKTDHPDADQLGDWRVELWTLGARAERRRLGLQLRPQGVARGPRGQHQRRNAPSDQDVGPRAVGRVGVRLGARPGQPPSIQYCARPVGSGVLGRP